MRSIIEVGIDTSLIVKQSIKFNDRYVLLLWKSEGRSLA